MNVLEARSALGNAARRNDPAAVEQARRDLATARIHREITTALESPCPPTPDQRRALASLLLADTER